MLPPLDLSPVLSLPRLVIAGGPRTGKTTLAAELARLDGRRVLHTDDLIPLGWSEASETASLWLDEPGPWALEGVAAVRALRKRLARGGGLPCDGVVWLALPVVERSAGQESMARGCSTVWAEVLPELRERGVQVLGLQRTPSARIVSSSLP